MFEEYLSTGMKYRLSKSIVKGTEHANKQGTLKRTGVALDDGRTARHARPEDIGVNEDIVASR